MTLFWLCDSNKRDSVLFLTWPSCSKGTCAPLWYTYIKSCNSGAGFGANIGSERSQNSLQLGENGQVEEASAWNFIRRRFSEGSAAATKRKKVPSQKFLPAYHEASPCLVPSRKGSEFVLCTTCKSDLSCKNGGWFDCKQHVESKSYKVFFSSFMSVSFSLSPPFSLLV